MTEYFTMGWLYGKDRPTQRMNFRDVEFVVLDEKEDEMVTKLVEIYAAFQKWNEGQQELGRSFGSLHMFGDGSGSIVDGNDDLVCDWGKDFDGALEAISNEIEYSKPAWSVKDCGLGCHYFLVNEYFGLRYPIAANSLADEARSMAEQLAKLANRDMPRGWKLPIGTQVVYTGDNDTKHEGIIIAVDTAEDSEADNSYDGVYLVNFPDLDDTDEDYQSRLSVGASGDDVKVNPHDPLMRLLLLQTASAYAFEMNALGLLI